ncbi:hypothetical protein GEMRC1_012239 [Eukaryota sp. GEM-RC1]
MSTQESSRCSSTFDQDPDFLSFQSESESYYDAPTYQRHSISSSSRSSARRRRRRKVSDILVCLDYCKYEVVANAVRDLGYKIVEESEDWNLYWMDRSVALERVLKLNPYQRVNHFPGMSEIARKDNLARNLTRMARNHPEQYDFFPLTWVIPQELFDFRNNVKSRKTRTTFISKPDASCQGKGIFLTRNPLDEITDEDNCVVQEYISKPFLINNTKFDLRVYALVLSVDPLVVYYYDKGLARFCTEEYVEPSAKNLDNVYVHLTNYAINKTHEKFVQNQDLNDDAEGSKWSLNGISRVLSQGGIDTDRMWELVKEGVVKTLIAIQPTLAHTYRTVVGSTSHTGCSLCFEILGFDFLIDHKGKPILLEVNHSPSFSTDSPLDMEVKSNLIRDTLTTLEETTKEEIKRTSLWQKTRQKDKKFRSIDPSDLHSSIGGYSLIYPHENLSHLNDLFLPPTTQAETTSSRMRRANVEKKLKEREEAERREKELRERRERKKIPIPLSSRSEQSKEVLRPRRSIVPDPIRSLSPPTLTSDSSTESLLVIPPVPQWPIFLEVPQADKRLTDNLIGRSIEEGAERNRLYDRVVRENLLKSCNVREFVYRLFKPAPSRTHVNPSGNPGLPRSQSTLGQSFSLRSLSHGRRKPLQSIVGQPNQFSSDPNQGRVSYLLSGTALVPQSFNVQRRSSQR